MSAKKKTHEQFVKDIISKYNIQKEDFTFLSEYQGYDKLITFQCNKCGKVKTVTAGALLRTSSHKKHICQCYSYTQEWHEENQFLQNWIKNQSKYDIVEYTPGFLEIQLKCKKCGTLQKRSAESLEKNDECLGCENKCNIKKSRQVFEQELKNFCGEEYQLIGDYNGSDNYCLLKHTLCGKIYRTKPHYLLTGKGGTCPICQIKSKGEKAIIAFLNQRNITYYTQYRLDEFRRAPYDFFLPDYNLLIEFQGIQHFQPVPRFGGELTYQRQKEVDEKKVEIAKKENKQLLIINYNQINEIETILAQRLSLHGSSNNIIAKR